MDYIFDKVTELVDNRLKMDEIKSDLHRRVEEVFFRYIEARRWSYELSDCPSGVFEKGEYRCLGLDDWEFVKPYTIKVTLPYTNKAGKKVLNSFRFSAGFLFEEESLKWFEEDEKRKVEKLNNLVYDEPVKFSSTGNYGCGPSGEDDVYTVEEFRRFVKEGGFIDSDGSGCPVKNKKAARWEIMPSRLHEIPPDATHIVWYNK